MGKFIVKKHRHSLKEGKNKRDLLLLFTTEGSEFLSSHNTHCHRPDCNYGVQHTVTLVETGPDVSVEGSDCCTRPKCSIYVATSPQFTIWVIR